MGFGQGLSGLKGASQKLDVIGNNIANSGTVGFKSSSVSFADVYASSRVGLGTQVAAINQNFSIGTISNTGGQFDMAIDGASGLFRVVDTSGNVLYTRNGEFRADKSGYLVNPQGHQLTGYVNGGTTPQPLRVPSGNIAPKATDSIETKLNLNSSETALPYAAGTPPNPADPSTYHHSLPITVYDSHGNSHQVTQYFVKTVEYDPIDPSIELPNTWRAYYAFEGDPTLVPADGHPITFSSKGEINSGDSFTLSRPGAAAVDPLNISISYANSTQFAGDFTYNFDQNGFPTGEYSSMSIGPNGQIIASYTNGEVQDMGFLVLANFNNLQGLQPVGGNAWRETSESGQPILGTPGSNGMALIKGQALEESNVDMGTELVNMIITQRTYQANAQTITTQSEILQTLINIR